MPGIFAVKFTAIGKLLPRTTHGVASAPDGGQSRPLFRFGANGLYLVKYQHFMLILEQPLSGFRYIAAEYYVLA
jgi:hypothetical protein